MNGTVSFMKTGANRRQKWEKSNKIYA